MKIGYARVSTSEQTTQPQADVLTSAGCERVVTETVSGAASSRPVLDRLLAELGSGDVLMVVRLDRLGRSLPHLIEVVRAVEVRGAGLRSLSEAIDTTTAGGRLIFHMMGALAEFERALIVERTQAGLAAARKRGVQGGPARQAHGRSGAPSPHAHRRRRGSLHRRPFPWRGPLDALPRVQGSPTLTG